MARVEWTKLAQSELESAIHFIGVQKGRPETARRLLRELNDRVEAYFAKDLKGHVHPNLPKGWRYVRFKRWLIAFAPAADCVIIRRVIDASRDLRTIFDTDD